MSFIQSHYDQSFKIRFLESKGEAFQLFFEHLMGYAYRSDFIACKPYGKQGDKKNDGILPSERKLFQVYAPRALDSARTKAKITEDFDGAKAHWSDHFDTWVFVHNDGALPPEVITHILNLRKANPRITIETWGEKELLSVFRKISPADLASWMGPPPTAEVISSVGFDEIQLVLESLAKRENLPVQPAKPVSPGKIEANDLSEDTRDLLNAGTIKSPLVARFFERWNDATYGERMSGAFRKRYIELRDMKPPMHPDDIYTHLFKWAGGGTMKSTGHQMAIYAVLAHFFESCDIFEPAKEKSA